MSAWEALVATLTIASNSELAFCVSVTVHYGLGGQIGAFNVEARDSVAVLGVGVEAFNILHDLLSLLVWVDQMTVAQSDILSEKQLTLAANKVERVSVSRRTESYFSHKSI